MTDVQRANSIDGGQPGAAGAAEPRTLAEYWARVRRWHRYNATLHIGEGVSTFFGLTCFAPQTVLALYVGLLTRSKLLIALPEALFIFSWSFPQLFFAYYLQLARQRRALTVWTNAPSRIPLLLLALSALLVPRLGVRFGLVTLFLLMAVNVIPAGIGSMAWQDLLGRIIAPEKRGRFFGLKQATGMAAAAASAYSMGRLLGWLGDRDPQNYAAPFFVGFALFTFSLFLLGRSKEPYYPREREPLRGYWRYLLWALGLLRRDPNFARYLLVRVLLPCAWLFPMSLYSAYAQEVFHIAPSTVIAFFTPMLYAGQIMVAPLAGVLGDRLGFKSLLVVASGAMVASLGVGLTLPLWGGRAAVGFVLVYLLFGMGYASSMIGNFNIVMEFAHVEDRPAYMGLAATLGAPTMLLVPALGGWLVDLTDYVPVMAAALVIALLVGVIAAFGFREPRTAHPDLEGLGLAPR